MPDDDTNTVPNSPSEIDESDTENTPEKQVRNDSDDPATAADQSVASLSTSEDTGAETGKPRLGNLTSSNAVVNENESPSKTNQPSPPLTDEEKEDQATKEDHKRLRNYSILLTLITLVFAHTALAILLIFFDIPVPHVIFGPPWKWLSFVGMAVLSCAGSYVAYKNLRKGLLARHRLYILAGQYRSGNGFVEVAIPGMVCLAIAFILALTKCRLGECSPAAASAIYGLMMIGSLFFSVWLLHLADYSYVSRDLSADKTGHLSNTIQWLSEATVARLEETERFHKKIRRGASLGDDLPDREIGQDVLKTLLRNLEDRLTKFQADENFNLLMKMYGDVVALFHPDYLPHLAHVYLKISQLRALNMAPRRIQLLGRRWTVKGLESEYVVVHDISELRPEYFERTPVAPDIGQPGDSAANDAVKKASLSTEPKWKQRSLKKRAIVTVAPDGSLLSIAIEEERQFNI
jgi:hypothetical protein